jgi:hypothetical protein
MQRNIRLVALAGVMLSLSACDNMPGTKTPPAQYKITEDGSAYVKDTYRFESLDQKSLTRGQKYKIISLAGGDKPPHFLVANITQYYGNKKGEVDDGKLLFIKDGSATYDCSKYLTDLKLSLPDDDVPNVTCKFEVVGTLPLASKAVLRTGN